MGQRTVITVAYDTDDNWSLEEAHKLADEVVSAAWTKVYDLDGLDISEDSCTIDVEEVEEEVSA